MRHGLLASVAALGLALAAPAMAQSADFGGRPGHEPGTGLSEPMSRNASNIDHAGSHSDIAPRLPTPSVGEDAGARSYVGAAREALARNRTGEAQEALERAETRMLDNRQSGDGPMLDRVEQARQALGRHDIAGARRILGEALAQNGTGSADVGRTGMTGAGSGASGGANMGGQPGYGAGIPSAGPAAGGLASDTAVMGGGGKERPGDARMGGVSGTPNGYPASPSMSGTAGSSTTR